MKESQAFEKPRRTWGENEKISINYVCEKVDLKKLRSLVEAVKLSEVDWKETPFAKQVDNGVLANDAALIESMYGYLKGLVISGYLGACIGDTTIEKYENAGFICTSIAASFGYGLINVIFREMFESNDVVDAVNMLFVSGRVEGKSFWTHFWNNIENTAEWKNLVEFVEGELATNKDGYIKALGKE